MRCNEMAGKAMKLDLGCGSDKPRSDDSWLGVDVVPGHKVDLVCDLNVTPWPWKDNSIDEIQLLDCLEHLDSVENTILEAYRILKTGGCITIEVPHKNGLYSHFSQHYHSFTRFYMQSLCTTGHYGNTKTLFTEISYHTRILFARWTPLDWIASRWPFFWEKFCWPQPDVIIWKGRKL